MRRRNYREEFDRKKDLEFLATLRTATREQLLTLEHNFQHDSAPAWKKIAIARALQRLPKEEET